jgi:hypothetical protein
LLSGLGVVKVARCAGPGNALETSKPDYKRGW